MSDQSSTSLQTGAALELRDLEICYGSGATAVSAIQGITLSIPQGEFLSVLGPSGCGKSTLIGAVAGFTRPSRGTLIVNGQPVEKPGADRGVVFQQHTLFPWKTVAGNVEFGLKMQGIGRAERRERAREILELMGLGDFLSHFPAQLSGGMQQRVNLARVLVNRPAVLLMDEPFSALDAQTRLQMQEMLLDLWSELRMTVIFVTHDIDEAIFLSDRIIVCTQRPGRIKAELPVSIERPRSTDLLTSAEFVRLKRECLDLLRSDLHTPKSSPQRSLGAAPVREPVLSF